MKFTRVIVFMCLLVFVSLASATEGMVAVKSTYSAKQAMDRLVKIVKKKGLKVFARINHAAGAAKIGKKLSPTELLIFGNPQGGTPFMECAQTVGIDLPLKALVWEDADKQVWIGYNDPEYIAKRHGVPECPVAKKLQKALKGITEAALAH